MGKKFVGVYIDEKDTLANNTDKVLNQLKHTLLHKIVPDTAFKLLFWINSWGAKYLPEEKSFDSKSLLKYEEGNILQVDLGFKVGSEQGGLHYAVVIDKDNKQESPVIMIVPLKSLDEGESIEDIDKSIEVYLGNQIFINEIPKLQKKLDNLNKQIDELKTNIEKLEKKKSKYEKEISNMKKGTIAQVSQICALSKMRICHPVHTNDRLYGLKLDPKLLYDIHKKFNQLYF